MKRYLSIQGRRLFHGSINSWYTFFPVFSSDIVYIRKIKHCTCYSLRYIFLQSTWKGWDQGLHEKRGAYYQFILFLHVKFYFVSLNNFMLSQTHFKLLRRRYTEVRCHFESFKYFYFIQTLWLWLFVNWVKKKLKVSCSVMPNSAVPCTVPYHAPLSMGFLWQKYWNGLHALLQVSSWPTYRIQVCCSSCMAGRFFTTWAIMEAQNGY